MSKVYKSSQGKNSSSRSRIIAARVNATQAFLLNRDYPKKTSAVVRALLRLLFNKKIPNFNEALEFELNDAETAIQENLENHRAKLVVQKLQKESEIRGNVRTRSGS